MPAFGAQGTGIQYGGGHFRFLSKFTSQYNLTSEKTHFNNAFMVFRHHTLRPGFKRQSSKEARRAEKRERISAMVKQEEEGVLAYYKQSAFGVQLRTNGFGAFYELGRMKTPRRTNLVQP
jgi:hypothetical protein